MNIFRVTSQRPNTVRARDLVGYFADETTANSVAATVTDGQVAAVAVFEGSFEDYRSRTEDAALEAARNFLSRLDSDTRARLTKEFSETSVAPA